MKKYLIGFLYLAIMLSQVAVGDIKQQITFDELYESPKNYTGSQVEVVGYLEIHIEGNTVCASEEESHCLLLKSLDVGSSKHLNNKKVVVRGTFVPVDINQSKVERIKGELTVQFGPNFHELHSITKIVESRGEED